MPQPLGTNFKLIPSRFLICSIVARIAGLSEEEYAKEFPEEHNMEEDLEGGDWTEEYEGADEGEHSEEL